jgi:F-type H+-transporting ATPase subunit gamma
VTRLAEIERRITGIGELLDIVGAMRSLASLRVQSALKALPGIRRYTETMASAIGSALTLLPEAATDARRGGPGAVVLFCAEHGFVGGFNERLFDAADTVLSGIDELLVLGSRGAALAEERGRRAAASFAMATRLESVPEAVRRLAAALYPRLAAGAIARAEVVFTRSRQGGGESIERQPLFPLDLRQMPARQTQLPPLHNLAAGVLIEKLIGEYFLALLTEAATESLASENAARFRAMDSAHENIRKKRDRLLSEARQARQEEITTELLDVVTGAAAMQDVTR